MKRGDVVYGVWCPGGVHVDLFRQDVTGTIISPDRGEALVGIVLLDQLTGGIVGIADGFIARCRGSRNGGNITVGIVGVFHDPIAGRVQNGNDIALEVQLVVVSCCVAILDDHGTVAIVENPDIPVAAGDFGQLATLVIIVISGSSVGSGSPQTIAVVGVRPGRCAACHRGKLSAMLPGEIPVLTIVVGGGVARRGCPLREFGN